MGNEMTFKIDFGPTIDFFRTLPTNVSGFMTGLEWWHYYLLCCWMFSFFVVPPKLKSLGSVVLAPAWMPFYVLTTLVNFVLAAKRGASIASMTESVSRATTNLEATAGKLKEAQFELKERLDNLEKKNVGTDNTLLKTLLEKLNDLANQNVETQDFLNEIVGDIANLKENLENTNGILDSVYDEVANIDTTTIPDDLNNRLASIEDSITNIEEVVLGIEDVVSCDCIKENTKDSENSISALENNVRNDLKNINDLLSKLEQSRTTNSLNNNSSILNNKSLQEFIVQSFKDKGDNWYVPLGVLNNSGVLSYRLAVRLGAIRNNNVTEADICKFTDDNQKIVKILPNGLPTFESSDEKKVNTSSTTNNINTASSTVGNTVASSSEKKTKMTEAELIKEIERVYALLDGKANAKKA